MKKKALALINARNIYSKRLSQLVDQCDNVIHACRSRRIIEALINQIDTSIDRFTKANVTFIQHNAAVT